ncbi:MAG: ABC transporter ATP-binding protein, partial [Bacillota bacterium]
AVVPQATGDSFDFTVYELVMMGRNPYQNRWGSIKEEDRQIVEWAMRLTDTLDFRKKQLTQLSGGEKQRVIIARALAQQPDILLLDEPTSSLDINYQGGIFDLISRLNQELEITMIVVSHDLNLVSQYCDRLLLFNEGQIYASGSVEEVINRDNIARVYNTEVIIRDNPLTDRPYVILKPRTTVPENRECQHDYHIHIIGGGGTAGGLLYKFAERACRLSCGILNQGDSDWKRARRLSCELVEIPPFVSINEQALRQNRQYLEQADLIIVSSTPFGNGNLDNLRLLTEIEDKPIIMINSQDFSRRDYTGGRAEYYWKQLLQRTNSYLADDDREALQIMEEILN